MMKDWNDIANFGGAVCLPGDIVFGAGGGVLFIPAHCEVIIKMQLVEKGEK